MISGVNRAAKAAIARKRITSNVRRLVAATKKTLESKISEAGRERISAPLVGDTVNAMVETGELIRFSHSARGESFSLPDADPVALELRRTQLQTLLGVYHAHSSGVAGQPGNLGREGVLGKAAEDMLGRAFANSTTTERFFWGDTSRFRDVTLTQPSDGLIAIRDPVQGYKVADHLALVEVKNRRDWPYPENYMPWKLVRNAYKFDMVGVYFSRRIPRITFWAAFKAIGAVAVETFNQFAPPDVETTLAGVRHKDGLGYHDLYFSEVVPPYLQRQVDKLPERILSARDRMKAVGHIVEPYLDRLADKKCIAPERPRLMKTLRSELEQFDKDNEADETAATDEEAGDKSAEALDGYGDDEMEARLELERELRADLRPQE